MQKVKITATTHPRLNVGYLYIYEKTSTGFRLTSLGGKHSVHFPTIGGSYGVQYTPVTGTQCKHVVLPHAPQPFHTETHVRIGERVAADLWREEYIGHSGAPAECAKFADEAVSAFLKRWEDGFFRGGVAA